MIDDDMYPYLGYIIMLAPNSVERKGGKKRGEVKGEYRKI